MIIIYRYVQIVARVRMRAINSNTARHVKWLSIAIENVKLLIGHNIRKSVRDVPLNYTTKSCSNNLHQQMIVRYVLCVYQRYIQEVDIKHVVEK